jgi:hypothetical protein
MIKFFTLILGLVLLCPRAKAQYTQNFETGGGVLGTNCLEHTQFIYTNGSDAPVINGTGSAYTNPPTSSSEDRSLTTPFLTITTDPLTISFNYQLSNKLNGNATRVITVGLLDRYGAFTPLDQIMMDKNTATTAFTYDSTFTGVTPGIKRISFRIGGATGDGNSRMIYDDLYVSANPYYGPENNCNSSPQVVSNNYFSSALGPVTGNVLTDDPGADWDPNGETLIAALSSQPADTAGTLTFNPDGSFTFTPAPGFTGGLVTFTYRATDDGYPATISGAATVTISYMISTLPVQLTAFSGKLTNEKAELSWSVAGNETVGQFVVERSKDGKNFSVAGTVAATSKTGSESYRFTDAVPVKGKQVYRLRMTDKQSKEKYSKSLLLQADASAAPTLRVLGNPGASELAFTFQSSHDSKVMVRIYNLAGQRVYARSSAVKSGVNQLTVEGQWLPAGHFYVLEVMTDAGERCTIKFRK